MKTYAIVLLSLALAGAAAAQSLAPTALAKAPPKVVPDLPPPARQGGDTIADAFHIPSLPFDDTGTTAGYADDYAAMCPYGNQAPDVVYELVPTVSESIDIDLCGSGYDTLILVFDENLSLVACNDDYYFEEEPCGVYVSFVANLPVVAGETYYIMVDGYGSSFGDYQLRVEAHLGCLATCLPGEAPEGEPPLQNDQPNACNDDYYFEEEPCGVYVSFVANLPVVAGETYYIMVDGYGSSFGDYQLRVEAHLGCLATCLPGEAPEGEPPLQNDQPNAYNDGCGGGPGGFQELPGDANGAINVCGVSGWFTFYDSDYRDTDWFTVTVGPGGVVHAELFAEWPTSLFHLAPTDCNTVSVVQQVTSSCTLATMDVVGAPGEVIWLWTGPTTFSSPTGENPYEFDYDLNLTGLEPVIATEAVAWGAIKSLYR